MSCMFHSGESFLFDISVHHSNVAQLLSELVRTVCPRCKLTCYSVDQQVMSFDSPLIPDAHYGIAVQDMSNALANVLRNDVALDVTLSRATNLFDTHLAIHYPDPNVYHAHSGDEAETEMNAAGDALEASDAQVFDQFVKLRYAVLR